MLPRFTGPIRQVPPAYSALKIDGKPAYARARAGEEVEMKAREVTVHALTIRHPRRRREGPRLSLADQRGLPPARGGMTITLSATVSKGTYIRSLARDIAHALGTVGHVTMLRRTRAGPFGLETAISLDFLERSR